MSIIQSGILGVANVHLSVLFKGGKAEYGIYISVALSLLIFLGILGQLQVITEAIARIGGYIRLDGAYMGTLIKMLGVTYIAEFSSGICRALCRDAGYQTIAQQIEIFGKLTILVLSLPVLLALLETIGEFLS